MRDDIKKWRTINVEGENPGDNYETRAAIEEELGDYDPPVAVEILASVAGLYGYTLVKL